MSEDPTPTDSGTPGSAEPTANGDHTPDRNGSAVELWPRVVELERQARWLSAKCDYLRHSCRGLLQTVGSPGPLTDEQVRLIAAESPRQSQAEAIEETIRLREERAAGLPPIPSDSTAEQLSRRVAELQPAVAVLTAQREALRAAYLPLALAFDPYLPTEDEIRKMMAEPPGPSIREIVAEVERERGG